MEQQPTDNNRLIAGELYLFHPTDDQCPPQSSLWGQIDGDDGGEIRLESCSRDLQTFALWQPLPAGYRFRRLATRSELRDYSYNLAVWEYARHR